MYWLLPVKIRPFGGRGKRRATGRGPNRRLSAGTIAAIMRRVEESPMSRIVFRNAMVLDPAKGDLAGERNVLVEDGTIAAVSKEALEHEDARAVDLEGRTLMPGLCDAHVHVTAVTPDFAALRHWSPFYVAARAADILEGMLMRGFTTVRDAGGADFGLAQAVEEGYIAGPRILFCGKALSQTGGHGDMRGPGEHSLGECFCCAGLGHVCDGVTEVRRAARTEIRKGANQIKIMASGGVSSPTDRISNLQFSVEEMSAIVAEAEAAGLYVMAHAYTADAVNRALECGVRSIEHGNLLDSGSIDLFAKTDAFLVPTLSTYHALWDEGVEAGLPADMHGKIAEVMDAGMTALELADRSGVKIAYGTDLLGSMHRHQSNEFALRAQVQASDSIIRSATTVAAELFGLAGRIGVVAEGARADLLVVDGNPLDDLSLLQDQGRHMPAIMKDGVFCKNELG
jgi:imidazolonepropionase-like amidohydrolase